MRVFAAVVCFLSFVGTGHAGVVTFTGEDLNAGPGGTFTNSNNAASQFATAAAAIGNIGTINFESSPVASFTSLSPVAGVTLTGQDSSGSDLYVSNTPNFVVAALDGFNTTPGGSNYVELMGGTLTFTFHTPVQFFGAYLMGIQTNFFQDTVTFSDGSSQSIDVPGTGATSSNGAVTFVGFTDAGASISSVTITAGNRDVGSDFIGIDDVSFQTATPEPSSFALVLGGCLGLAFARRKLTK